MSEIEVSVESLSPGTVLTQPIRVNGMILVRENSVVTANLLGKLKNHGVEKAWVNETKVVKDENAPKTAKIDDKRFFPGDFVCLQGEKSESLYILKKGKLEVVVVPHGTKVSKEVVNSLGKVVSILEGENINFGEIGAILSTTRSASIRAKEESIVGTITVNENFSTTISTIPKLGINIATTLSKRIKDTNNKVNFLKNLHQKIDERSKTNMQIFFKLVDKIGQASSRFTSSHWSRQLHEKLKNDPYYIAAVRTFRLKKKKDQNQDDCSDSGSVPSLNTDNLVEYEMNDIICNEGEPGKELYILVSGRIGVYVGDHRVATISKHGTVIGEIAVLIGRETGTYENRTATLKAVTYTQIMVVPGDSLDAIVQKDPGFISHIVKQLAEELPNSNKSYVELKENIEDSLKELDAIASFKELTQELEKNLSDAENLVPGIHKISASMVNNISKCKLEYQKEFLSCENK
ncbi:MAG: hypothetical protein C0601_02305 [Candidatus Muiribacterium halophilum]|uniref:Cyclic nucleotide-binding domain-containing protein n=1 Tax=Muiribacterium halophilum TaxID=2053465 RepID=A0A2N5ZKZ7_MUIH1|nr:MAG: hypothetical protein C0601_02305 [Candidatus Muirbacterium halophilum]